jgi:shikimate dehydrogenase
MASFSGLGAAQLRIVETELLKAARAIGCRTVDGGTMAVGQAIGAFELFTGMKADAQRMEQHFLRLLAAR